LSLRRAIRTVLPSLLGLVLAATICVQAAPAGAGTVDDEQLFVRLINQTRAESGLPPLVVHPELTAQARTWASSMAGADQLSHAPDITAGISAPWTVLGENVGVHAVHEPEQLYQAFVASPSHYRNLVDPRFRYVGVGVVNTPEGKIWTTHRFMATSEPAPTTAPKAAPPTTVPPTTPTTTVPATAAPTTTAAPPSTKAPTPTTSRSSPTTRPAAPSNPADPSVDGPADPPLPPDDGPTAQPPPDAATTGDPGDGPIGEPEPARPAAGPGRPDITTVEGLLIGLIEAGI